MKRITGVINKILLNKTFKNSTWMLFANGGKLLISGIYFILLARILGPKGYGVLAGVLAIVGIISPFSGWGSANIIVQNVARDKSKLSVNWGNAIFVSIVSGTVFTVLTLGFCSIFLGNVNYKVVLLLAISEMIFTRIMDASSKIFQALEKLNVVAVLSVLLSLTKLISVYIFTTFNYFHTPDAWAWWYLFSSIVTSMLGFFLVSLNFGKPKLEIGMVLRSFKEGFYFAIGSASGTIYNDIDKIMLARFCTFESTGIYAAAYRIVQISLTPISSILAATYAKFFKHGNEGIEGSLSYAKRIVPYSATLGLIISISLFVFAPAIPFFLGHEYDNSIGAMRLIAVLPFLQSIHYFLADTLSGSGYQAIRSKIQIGVAFFNIILNIWLIPRYSWKGAGITSIIADSTLLVMFSLSIFYIKRTSNKKSKKNAESI